MVTVSLGSEVSGMLKGSGGRLISRLTLTLADAMLARDWEKEQKGCWGGGCLWGAPQASLLIPSIPPFPPGLGVPVCDRLTESTSISVMFQKAFQKCTSRFCMIRSNSAPRSSGSMAKRPLVKRELAVTPGGREGRQAAQQWGGGQEG